MSEHLPAGDMRDPPSAGREPIFNIPRVVLFLAGVCVGLHVLRVYGLSVTEDIGLLVRAAFIPIRYSGVFDPEIWAFTSPFTYAFLHGGFAHLAINIVWLAAFGSPLARRLGAVRFVSFWAVTGVAAAGLHYALHPLDQAPLIGASGAISGMMGAAARFGFHIRRLPGGGTFVGRPLPVGAVVRMRGVAVFLAVWMVVNLLTGLAGSLPGTAGSIAWEAHIGGFLAGFFGIGAFMPRRGEDVGP
jgi:membrane associated rhomboid family serine protease